MECGQEVPHDSEGEESVSSASSDCDLPSCESDKAPAVATSTAVCVPQDKSDVLVAVQTSSKAVFRFESRLSLRPMADNSLACHHRFLNTTRLKPTLCYRLVSPEEFAGRVYDRLNTLQRFFRSHGINQECLKNFSLCRNVEGLADLQKGTQAKSGGKHEQISRSQPSARAARAPPILSPTKARQIAQEAAQLLRDGCASPRGLARTRGKLVYYVYRNGKDFDVKIAKRNVKAMSTFIGNALQEGGVDFDVVKPIPQSVQDELRYWTSSLASFADSKSLLTSESGSAPSPVSPHSLAGDEKPDLSVVPSLAARERPAGSGSGSERKPDAVDGCKAVLHELQSHGLVSRELDSRSALLFKRFLERLRDRLGSSTLSKGWSLRHDFVSGMRASVESKHVRARAAEGLARAFDELYD
eukprot:188889-Rhodomonas_salina.1